MKISLKELKHIVKKIINEQLEFIPTTNTQQDWIYFLKKNNIEKRIEKETASAIMLDYVRKSAAGQNQLEDQDGNIFVMSIKELLPGLMVDIGLLYAEDLQKGKRYLYTYNGENWGWEEMTKNTVDNRIIS
jgi:hypothetical protein